MLNLIDHHVPKSLRVKYGFYILHRVQHHVLFTEDWNPGWGECTDVLRDLWARFDVIDRDQKQEKAS